MTTIGAEGFLSMLPVYVEHILFPTLTESSFLTEVHHVDGEGEDAGVVYCEMQARENGDQDTVSRAVKRAAFPHEEGRGYRAETAGMLANLRTTTTHRKVKEFHRAFYRPENLSILVVGGGVEPEDVFHRLEGVEAELAKRGKREDSFVRPWQSHVPPLTSGSDQEVVYPSDEEDNGLVSVAWRGHPVADLRGFYSLHCLLEYLTESSVSPLKAAFVECEDPLCST